MESHYIGQGVYTVAEASRLIGVDARSIARWIRGYHFHSAKGERESVPVFSSEFLPVGGKLALSFLDLVEVRFVAAFRKHGVSWRAIRVASRKASQLLQCGHPFSTQRFLTDGRTIVGRIAREQADVELIDLVTDQLQFERIISPLLYRGLEFSKHDQATRWWPRGKNHLVVIDPRRSFGKPIIERYGIPTATLAASYRANKSYAEVAKWFEVDEQSVREAINFERRVAA